MIELDHKGITALFKALRGHEPTFGDMIGYYYFMGEEWAEMPFRDTSHESKSNY